MAPRGTSAHLQHRPIPVSLCLFFTWSPIFFSTFFPPYQNWPTPFSPTPHSSKDSRYLSRTVPMPPVSTPFRFSGCPDRTSNMCPPSAPSVFCGASLSYSLFLFWAQLAENFYRWISPDKPPAVFFQVPCPPPRLFLP